MSSVLMLVACLLWAQLTDKERAKKLKDTLKQGACGACGVRGWRRALLVC